MAEAAEKDAGRAAFPKKRTRSPNYPMFSLGEALTKIKMVFENEKRNPTPPEVLYAHFGYKKESGTAGRAVSALKQYGLLDEKSGSYAVSDLAYSILFGEEGSVEKEENIRRAALKPLIFNDLIKAFPDGLPSDASLKAHLITKRGFNPDAVAEFIRLFKETISLAKVIPGEYSVPSAEEPNMTSPEQQDASKPSIPPPAGTQIQVYNYGLSQPRRVRAEVKLIGQEFRQDDIELLIENLLLLKKSFEKGGN